MTHRICANWPIAVRGSILARCRLHGISRDAPYSHKSQVQGAALLPPAAVVVGAVATPQWGTSDVLVALIHYFGFFRLRFSCLAIASFRRFTRDARAPRSTNYLSFVVVDQLTKNENAKGEIRERNEKRLSKVED